MDQDNFKKSLDNISYIAKLSQIVSFRNWINERRDKIPAITSSEYTYCEASSMNLILDDLQEFCNLEIENLKKENKNEKD